MHQPLSSELVKATSVRRWEALCGSGIVQEAAPTEMGAVTDLEDDAMAELKVVDGAPRTALARLVDDLINRRAAGASRRTIANLELALKRIFLPWCADQVIADVSQLTSRHLTGSRPSCSTIAAPGAS